MKPHNQHITAERIGTKKAKLENWNISSVKSPQISIKHWKNFKLNEIPVIFKIAEFERVKADGHIRKITKSIVENQFFDNVIRVIKKNNDWYVIDGQHRLAALYVLYKDFGLETYDLIIIEYPTTNGRIIYRKNNLGKSLSVAHHLKAIDNNTIPFFNDLREFLTHDDNNRILTYAEMARCHNYATTGLKSINIPLEDVVMSFTPEDIEQVKSFIRGLLNTMPTREKGNQFRMSFMMSVYSVAYSRKLNQVEITNLIMKGLKDKEIIDSLPHIGKADTVARTTRFNKLCDNL